MNEIEIFVLNILKTARFDVTKALSRKSYSVYLIFSYIRRKIFIYLSIMCIEFVTSSITLRERWCSWVFLNHSSNFLLRHLSTVASFDSSCWFCTQYIFLHRCRKPNKTRNTFPIEVNSKISISQLLNRKQFPNGGLQARLMFIPASISLKKIPLQFEITISISIYPHTWLVWLASIMLTNATDCPFSDLPIRSDYNLETGAKMESRFCCNNVLIFRVREELLQYS